MSDKGEMDDLYGIGAVAKRTGLTPAGIRMWEKRYGVVEPVRSGTNRRLYRGVDVERLALLKTLTDGGHAISNIVELALEELRKRVSEEVPKGMTRKGPEILVERGRLLVIGRGLDGLIGKHEILEAELVGELGSLEEVGEELPETDLLVVNTETLFPETMAKVREVVASCGAARTILLYRFTSSKTVRALAKTIDHLSLWKGPVENARLRRECVVQLNSLREPQSATAFTLAEPIPARLYELDQLTRIANIPTTIECECPQHLAGLLQSLSAFEQYSQECEDRNPDDALLHAFLHRTTAQARRTLEEALRHLVLVEGIELEG